MYQEPTSPSNDNATDLATSPDQDDLPATPADQKPVTQQELSRLRRLLWVFGLLVAVLISPSVAGKFQFALTAAKERARMEVARENLQEINLGQSSTASELLCQYIGPSVVHIRTESRRGRGLGSGVIVDKEGYIVTNYHVVQGVGSVEVQLSDGRRSSATVIGADPLVDVAVLKTELDNLSAAEWGDSDELNVGAFVWAVGSPFGLQKSITRGILSAKERRGFASSGERRGVASPPISVYQEFLQTDAAVNPGNSGGPLVNVNGEVIGINTAIIGRSYQGISFSIPSAIARASYEQLRKDGWVRRGYLGVAPTRISERTARRLGLEQDHGVLIVEVRANTPADDAGMVVGDVILTWDGVEFSDPTLMSRAIAATEIGSKVPVEVLRRSDKGTEELTLTVTVAARPSDSP